VALIRPVHVDHGARDELGAWLAMCEALGIVVEPLGCGEYRLTVPLGVRVPEPPPWR
jgi:hypothetical protein